MSYSSAGDAESAPVQSTKPRATTWTRFEGEQKQTAMPTPAEANISPSTTKKMSPDDLRRLFRQYDVDGSGEISEEELEKVLVTLMGRLPSHEAVTEILKDIDIDGSGSIDEDEFIEFFGRLETLVQMQAKLRMMGEKSGFFRKVAIFYAFLNFVAFCAFCLLDLSAEPGSDTATLGRIGFMISSVSLGFIVVGGLIAPIVQYKCGGSLDLVVQQASQLPVRGILDRRKAVLLSAGKDTPGAEMTKEQIEEFGQLTKEQKLERQADAAFENVPRPPRVDHAYVNSPLPPGYAPPTHQSYRPSIRKDVYSPDSSFMSGGFSDWPAQPSTPANVQETVGRPRVHGNANFTGYDVSNYQSARHIMASTGSKSFTPVACKSTAQRIPWLSAELCEQIQEAQPDLWVEGAWSSPATSAFGSALPSPTSRDLPPLPPHEPPKLMDMHLQAHALNLREFLPANKSTKMVKLQKSDKLQFRASPTS